LGIGDWAQSPIPNPQSPQLKHIKEILTLLIILKQNYKLHINYLLIII